MISRSAVAGRKFLSLELYVSRSVVLHRTSSALNLRTSARPPQVPSRSLFHLISRSGLQLSLGKRNARLVAGMRKGGRCSVGLIRDYG